MHLLKFTFLRGSTQESDEKTITLWYRVYLRIDKPLYRKQTTSWHFTFWGEIWGVSPTSDGIGVMPAVVIHHAASLQAPLWCDVLEVTSRDEGGRRQTAASSLWQESQGVILSYSSVFLQEIIRDSLPKTSHMLHALKGDSKCFRKSWYNVKNNHLSFAVL